LITEEFNRLEDAHIHGNYTYPKESCTTNLSIDMKTALEQNRIHPHPFKFVCGIQQCISEFVNQKEHID
jgi:hypothetical protein